MKNMQKKEKSINRLFFYMSVSFLIIIVLCLYLAVHYTTYTNNIELNGPWNFTYNGELRENVYIDQLSFDVTQPNDVLELTTKLPKLTPTVTLRLWMCHSAIDAYIDDEQIYSYGHDALKNYTMVGSGFYFIQLPQDYYGKTLKIVLHVGEVDAFSCFDPIMLSDSSIVVNAFLQDRFMYIISGVFLLVFGLSGALMALFFVGSSKAFRRLVMMFIAAALMGIWTLSNKGILQLFGLHYQFVQKLEFITLFLSPIPILLYFMDVVNEWKVIKRILLVLLYTIVVSDTVVLIAEWTDKIHFQNYLPFFHILSALMILLLFVISIKCIMSKDSSTYSIVVGGLGMLLGGTIDIVFFYLRKYFEFTGFYIDSATAFGELIFFVCMVANYFMTIMKRTVDGAKTEMLENLAYHDILTGLLNRLRFEELLDEMDKLNTDYAIMYFDLNGLKAMNDQNGHEAGDGLIKQFSECLKKAFGENSQVARMGGDEFAALFPGATKQSVLQLVERLQNEMKIHNEQYEIKLDTSIGVAFRKEVHDGKSRSVLKLADARMYHMKRQIKRMLKKQDPTIVTR